MSFSNIQFETSATVAAVFSVVETGMDYLSYVPGVSPAVAPFRMGLAHVEAWAGVALFSISLIAYLFDQMVDGTDSSEPYIRGMKNGTAFVAHAIGTGVRASVESSGAGYVALFIKDWFINEGMLYGRGVDIRQAGNSPMDNFFGYDIPYIRF